MEEGRMNWMSMKMFFSSADLLSQNKTLTLYGVECAIRIVSFAMKRFIRVRFPYSGCGK